jgi:Ca2+-binding EF-hand superfamily protein
LSAKQIFEKFDVDGNGKLDAEELDDMLFELGVRLTEANVAEARQALGLTKHSGSVDYDTFATWWAVAFGAQTRARNEIISHLSEKMRVEYIPHIRSMFAEADADKNGELDRAEFENFYPKLRDYLGYSIPPVVQCLNDMDVFGGFDGGDGLVEFTEFESWFLQQEKARAELALNA